MKCSFKNQLNLKNWLKKLNTLIFIIEGLN